MSAELVIFGIAVILSCIVIPVLNYFFPENFED